MRTLLCLTILSAFASVADARTIKLDGGTLTTWVPDQWAVDASNDAAVTAAAPSQNAAAMFVVQQVRDLDVAYKNVAEVVRALVPNAQFGKPKRVQIAGLSAIQLTAYADVSSGEATTKVELIVAVMITPGQRALYAITMVEAASASSFDGAIRKIWSSFAAGRGGTERAEPQKTGASRENPCWEMKSQPNGWSRREWNGVSYMLPRGWQASEQRDPNTDAAYLTITDGDASVIVFAYPAASHAAAWQAVASQVEAYGLGDAAWGEVSGQRALCARGSAADGVVFHKSGTALVMLGRASDPTTMRGVLGSMRWR
jgi:hypothetical protein